MNIRDRIVLICTTIMVLVLSSCGVHRFSRTNIESETTEKKPTTSITHAASPISTPTITPVTSSTSTPSPKTTPQPTIDEFMQQVVDAINNNNPEAILEAIHPEERGKFSDEILKKGIIFVKACLKEQEIISIEKDGGWLDGKEYHFKEFNLLSNGVNYQYFRVGVRPDGGFTICDERFLLAAGMFHFLEEYIDTIHKEDAEKIARLIYSDENGNTFSVDESERLLQKYREAFGDDIPVLSFSQEQGSYLWYTGIYFDIKGSEQVHRIVLLRSPIKEFLILDNWLELSLDFSLYYDKKYVVGTSVNMVLIKELFGEDVQVKETEISESPFSGFIFRDITCTGLTIVMVGKDNTYRVISYKTLIPLLSTSRGIRVGDSFSKFNITYPDAIVNYNGENQYQAKINDGSVIGLEMVFHFTDGILESITMFENIT